MENYDEDLNRLREERNKIETAKYEEKQEKYICTDCIEDAYEEWKLAVSSHYERCFICHNLANHILLVPKVVR